MNRHASQLCLSLSLLGLACTAPVQAQAPVVRVALDHRPHDAVHLQPRQRLEVTLEDAFASRPKVQGPDRWQGTIARGDALVFQRRSPRAGSVQFSYQAVRAGEALLEFEFDLRNLHPSMLPPGAQTLRDPYAIGRASLRVVVEPEAERAADATADDRGRSGGRANQGGGFGLLQRLQQATGQEVTFPALPVLGADSDPYAQDVADLYQLVDEVLGGDWDRVEDGRKRVEERLAGFEARQGGLDAADREAFKRNVLDAGFDRLQATERHGGDVSDHRRRFRALLRDKLDDPQRFEAALLRQRDARRGRASSPARPAAPASESQASARPPLDLRRLEQNLDVRASRPRLLEELRWRSPGKLVHRWRYGHDEDDLGPGAQPRGDEDGQQPSRRSPSQTHVYLRDGEPYAGPVGYTHAGKPVWLDADQVPYLDADRTRPIQNAEVGYLYTEAGVAVRVERPLFGQVRRWAYTPHSGQEEPYDPRRHGVLLGDSGARAAQE